MSVQMSAEMSLSLNFYKYLLQKIGSEKEVKIRRLTCIIDDLGAQDPLSNQITSGSKGEGLQLKGSDYDVMFIDPLFNVYESERDVVPQGDQCIIPLIMETDDTHPCFTQLRLPDNYNLTLENEKIINNILMRGKVSSELHKPYRIEQFSYMFGAAGTDIITIHGPCISTPEESHDFAFCLKCDKWISQAQPWIVRPRTTWPSPDIISKIISCGVLFVPIGYKGSINECLQWRISFSVAEKLLIFSFNQTQLLCYALLKILIKEIVEKDEDLKSLLCSYFLKTLLFWMLEESDPSIWIPSKIIPCFMSCLKRLIYYVEYSTLLHYFIPDNNLFYLRFDKDKKEKMTGCLKNLFEKGINCFTRSDTLSDIMRTSFNATDSSIARCVLSLYKMTNTVCRHPPRSFKRINHFLRYSKTKISRSTFFVMLSFAHQCVPQMPQHQLTSNKHKYYKYKQDCGHLLIGTNSDAVTGWLLLASFFYVHGNYWSSLHIIDYALEKCTDEKLYPWQNGLDQIQENLLRLRNQKELFTLSKAFAVRYPKFISNSLISPQELRLSLHEHCFPFHPIIFAHFLSFLCFYHLQQIKPYRQSLIRLLLTFLQHLLTSKKLDPYSLSILQTCIGICYQMIGLTNFARNCFQRASHLDEHNLSSAAIRLSNCNVE